VKENGMDGEMADKALDLCRQAGAIFEPSLGWVRLVQ
jgi:hypothetical protein